jgi:phosphoglucomutase
MPETSNVLQWFCEDGTKVSARPSGTEPKIKFYIEIKDNMTDPSQFEALEAKAEKHVEAIKKSLGLA